MKEITRFSVDSLRKDELAGFANDIERLLNARMKDGESLKLFSRALADYNAARGRETAKFQEAIESADGAVDHSYSQIKSQLKINTEHYDPAVQKAAQTAMDVVNRFNTPTHLAYQEEYAIIGSLIGALDELGAEVLEKAMIKGWLEVLRRQHGEFLAVMTEKVQTTALQEVGLVKKCRLALCLAYDNIIKEINARNILDGAHPYDQLIDEINTVLAAKRAALKVRKN